ncbi:MULTISPECIES: flagellar basal body-associated protein FliL [Alphaproteobacteria]|uniref:flagellar basal body-associated protein FliL n=1 Tax=Alphaproteobacteria TaxID=28211 RepID=UPI0013CB4F31|nr:flagellar basal body-associated protein FliL [Roseibium sp. RKSG952]MTI01431.1 flagellar basal body-associated protein FliL [Roseibium sp. RKSG952]
MIKKLVPVAFLLVGLAVGVGVGVFLTPAQKADAEKGSQDSEYKEAKGEDKSNAKKLDSDPKKSMEKSKTEDFEYLKLTKQFVVPVVNSEEISALVTMSVSLETRPGISEAFYAVEPKLRDSFLQVLFDHANTGGFDGNFTHSDNLSVLRKSLLEVAQKDLGDDVSRVLIMSVSRQDT